MCVVWEIHSFLQGSAESFWICSSSGCHSVCQNLQGARWLMLFVSAHELAIFFLCFACGEFFFMSVFMSGRIVVRSVRDISRIMLDPPVAEVARLKNGLV